MKPTIFLAGAACALAAFSGCTSVKFTDGDGVKTIGMPVYQPIPHLLINWQQPESTSSTTPPAVKQSDAANPQTEEGGTADNRKEEKKTEFVFQIIYLPSSEPVARVKPIPVFGSSKWSMELDENGVLRKIGGESDPQVDEAITAAGSVLATALSAAGLMTPADMDGDDKTLPPQTVTPQPLLYRIDVKNQTLVRYR